jgi:hypothetical protein
MHTNAGVVVCKRMDKSKRQLREAQGKIIQSLQRITKRTWDTEGGGGTIRSETYK